MDICVICRDNFDKLTDAVKSKNCNCNIFYHSDCYLDAQNNGFDCVICQRNSNPKPNPNTGLIFGDAISGLIEVIIYLGLYQPFFVMLPELITDLLALQIVLFDIIKWMIFPDSNTNTNNDTVTIKLVNIVAHLSTIMFTLGVIIITLTTGIISFILIFFLAVTVNIITWYRSIFDFWNIVRYYRFENILAHVGASIDHMNGY